MASNGIPPRWLRCPRRGDVIAEKFIPFKTPLDDKYGNQIPMEYVFTPSMFVKLMTSYKLKLGLWIDLTNTNRFYDKEEIENDGIQYVKLQCRGHSECPSEEQTQAFIQLCTNYISKHPADIIAVHCTHGFNRTGFLICSYLIENLSWSVDIAVRTFAEVRPPGIYKKDYIHELFARYGEIEDAPSAPTLPDWCFESEDSNGSTNDSVDDDGNKVGKESFNESDSQRKKHNHQVKSIFMEGVLRIAPVISYTKVQQIQQKCQYMCNWRSNSFPGSQPISMDIQNLSLLGSRRYKVSWKADGTRAMMLIDGKDEVYLIDRDNAVFKPENIAFYKRKQPDMAVENTLVDGEMIIDQVNGVNYPRYLIYDIVKFENIDVGGTDFDRRMLCIEKELIGPREEAKRDGRIDREKEPFSIRVKNFWELSTVESLLGQKFNQSLGHEVDGLIFQPVPDPYKAGRCIETLKWKPPTHNSVDFKLVIKTEQKQGMLRETIGYLWVVGSHAPFAQMKVTRELKQFDKKIIECRWDFATNQWKFMKQRTDKSFPNSFTTAIAVCESIKKPVTREILLQFISQVTQKKRPNEDDGKLMPPPKVPKR